jgi:hypothetical protein
VRRRNGRVMFRGSQAEVCDVNRYVDAWGNRIDEGIKPIVSTLWRHGFPTRWSCEGHIDFPALRPFVTIALDQSADRLPIDQIRKAVDAYRTRLQNLLDSFYGMAPLARPETRLILVEEPFRSGGQRLTGCAYMLRNTGSSEILLGSRRAALDALRAELGRFADSLERRG